MAIDPLGAALGSAAIFFTTYDTCGRLYEGCQKMRYFGRDVLLESLKMQNLKCLLDIIMETRTTQMRYPPDLNDPEHRVTKEIMRHLRLIETYFQMCEEIFQDALGHSGHTPREDQSATSPNALSTDTSSARSKDSGMPPSSVSTETTSATAKSKQRPRVTTLSQSRSLSRKRDGRTDSAHDLPVVPGPSRPSQIGVKSSQNARPPLLKIAGEPSRPLSKGDPESQRARSDASWWTLFKWSDHNQSRLRSRVEGLRNAIHDFRDYIELRRPTSPSAVLALDTPNNDVEPVQRFDPEMLREIHDSLMRINTSWPPQAVSVSIASSSTDNREVFGKFPGVCGELRRDSLVTFVQKQHHDAEHTFLAIESACVSSDTGSDLELASLDVESAADPGSSDRYSRCGRLPTYKNAEFGHVIFVEAQPWHRMISLESCLDDPRTAALLTLNVMVRLFRSILLAYLGFEKLRGCCQYPRLQDYWVFQPPSYADDQIRIEKPSDLPWDNPYWACGFGTPAPVRVPGTYSERVAMDEPIVRLGLVLFQLGSRSRSITANPREDAANKWSRLQREALSGLHKVQALYGFALGAIVEACLLSNAKTESKTIQSCLASLKNIEEDL